MGGAILRGWLAAGTDANGFVVVDPAAQDLPSGVAVYGAAQDVGQQFDIIVLGIKPQILPSLNADIAQLLAPGALVISILAGATIQTLAAAFPGARVIRLMPNLAAAIGKSPLAICAPHEVGQSRTEIATWLAPLGSVIWIDDENQMDAVTALAGSGPAFVYRFVDALIKGGEASGLPHDVSAQLAVAMTEGAAMLAAASGLSPNELAARVTSPGGTTAAGLAALDADGTLDKLIAETIGAAQRRGTELANGEIG